MSFVVINSHDKRPPYEQIARSVMAMIANGSLEAGDRLAPIRQLAGDLGVAPNTVARAYRELEQGGFVTSNGRRGTTVSDNPRAAATPAASTQLRTAIDKAQQAGMTARQVIDLVVGHLNA